MGFRCPRCKQDFGTDKAAFEKHLRDENVGADMVALAVANLTDVVKGVTMGIFISVDDVFDHLLTEGWTKKKKFQYNRHHYDRKTQGSITLNNKHMITVDVENGKITLTRYENDFAVATTEPSGIDEACRHIRHFVEHKELPDEEFI